MPRSSRSGSTDVTADETSRPAHEIAKWLPGVVVVFSGDAPTYRAIPLHQGKLTLGRGDGIDDDRMSREHALVAFDGLRWTIRDLGSRNGTFVDGVLLTGPYEGIPQVVRLGSTVYLPARDLRSFGGEGVVQDAFGVAGPRMQEARRSIDRAAVADGNLLVLGESGTGKELAAQRFHAFGSRAKGPLVSVNCAAIAESIAERLLFGAKKGAYSGANVDAPGYVQAADGGVLFLDEVGELALEVQAKLLRFIETREVLMLGAARASAADVRIVFATHRDLRASVGEGRFRADLYYRIGQPEVRIPPLRERREEIPWHIARAANGVRISAKLVEACLLRPWPGNVRELIGELRRAVDRATQEKSTKLRPEHLGDAGGALITSPAAGHASRPSQPTAPSDTPRHAARDPKTVSKVEVEAALASSEGKVAAAARILGLHRTQLYRLLERYGIATREDG